MQKVIVKEADILKQICLFLELNNIFFWRNNTGAYKTNTGGFVKFGKKGSGDILAIEPKTGRLISIEVKRQGNYPSPEQREFMRMVKKEGGIAFVARSVDDVIHELNLDKMY